MRPQTGEVSIRTRAHTTLVIMQDDDVRVVREGGGWSLVRAGELLAESFLDLGAAMRAARRVARDEGIDIQVIDRGHLAGVARYRPAVPGHRYADRFPVRLCWTSPRPAEFDDLGDLAERVDRLDITSGLRPTGRRVRFDAEDTRDDEGRWIYSESPG